MFSNTVTQFLLKTSVGVLENMSLASTLLEDTILCPWPWGRSLHLNLCPLPYLHIGLF